MSERDEGEPIPPALREEIARIIRRAFEAGRQASRHYQTTHMTETALEPIEADAFRVLVPPILADGGGSSRADPSPPVAARHGSQADTEPSAQGEK